MPFNSALLAENIRVALARRDITQADLARRIGVSKNTLQHARHPETARDMKVSSLIAICEGLGTSPNDLLGWDETAGNVKGSCTAAGLE